MALHLLHFRRAECLHTMTTKHIQHPNPDWQDLAEALREELKECAWLLHLMEDQQKGLLARNSASILETNQLIEEQLSIYEEKRNTRDHLMGNWARAHDLPKPESLAAIFPALPASARPLFQALKEEGETLLAKIQRRARQNHMILSRAGDFATSMLRTLRPEQVHTLTYNQRGRFARSHSTPGSVIRAAV